MNYTCIYIFFLMLTVITFDDELSVFTCYIFLLINLFSFSFLIYLLIHMESNIIFLCVCVCLEYWPQKQEMEKNMLQLWRFFLSSSFSVILIIYNFSVDHTFIIDTFQLSIIIFFLKLWLSSIQFWMIHECWINTWIDCIQMV